MADVDCTDVGKLIENRARKRSGFILLALLTKWQLDCLKQIQNKARDKFPEEQEKILLNKIKDLVKKLKPELILLDPKDLKFVGVSLLNYKVEGDVNFNKFLVESLLSCYKSISEKILNNVQLKNEVVLSKWKTTIEYLKEDHQIKFDLDSGTKAKIDKYLEVRRDINSLYKIHSIIKSSGDIVNNNDKSIKERKLALQRVFHITGEYLKDTETTPNLLPGVRQSLEEKGIPTKLLSEFRDVLAHYYVFPIEVDNEEIQQLFDEGFLPIQMVIEDKIIEIEKSFIQWIIEENESKIKDKSVVKQLKGSKSREGIKELLERIEKIKRTKKYSSMDDESKKLVDEIDQNALQMKSMDFSADQKKNSAPDFNEIKSQISNSITKYIEQSKLKVYEKLYNKLDLDNLDNAHDDVLKITKVIHRLHYDDTASPNNNILDGFLDMRVLGKISISKDLSLKKVLEKYFDAESFKKNDVHYVDFKDSVSENLIGLLNNNISGPDNNKDKLIRFFKSIGKSQGNDIKPDDYEDLVKGLSIDGNIKEKLLLYSVEWRKKKCVDLLKKYPPALKMIYDSIIEDKSIDSWVYKNLAYEYRLQNEPLKAVEQRATSLSEVIPGKIEILYLSRIKEEVSVLKEVNDRYAVESQIINIYSLLEKAKGGQGERFEVKKLRNYLSHGDALISGEDDKILADQLVDLKDKVIDQLGDSNITIQEIEGAIDSLEEHLGLKKVRELLCPIGYAGSRGSARRARSAIEGCLTWEEIDKFNEGGIENRDPDNIIIDSEKFMSSISNEFEANEEKFSKFIALASESEVIGDHKNKVNMLTNNHRYLGHLERVGKVSGMVMHGMIAKNIVRDLLHGDYEDVAINLGFLFGSQGLAKVAEVASMKGAGYMLEGRALLGKSLRFASPFLSRGISAFIAYDLYNQMKEYEKGNKDALVPIIGNSLQLGVDSIELGIEIGEGLGLELLEGVSAFTGPIGMAIGAVVFVGTDVYMAVRTVEKIDEKIHLTQWEKVTEGTRAIFGLQPSEDVEKLIEEKGANNQAVNSTISFFEGNPYIQRYVFPSIRVVKHAHEIILDNVVSLDQKRNDIKWSRTRPDNLEGIDLFCLPKGDWESVPKSGTYYCDGAIGVEYANNRAGNYTLINLGDGKDRVKGFQDSSNIFVLGDGHKEMTGGSKDDNFIFGEKSVNATDDSEIKGSIDGHGGIDTIDVGGLTPRYKGSKGVGKYQVFADFRQGMLRDTSKVALNISNINQFLGRKGRVDQVVSACDTKHMDGKGGENKNYLDSITIPRDDACFYDTKVIINPYTKVTNSAINGNFTYFIRGEKGKEAYIDLGPNSQSSNTFAFNYTLKDVAAIDKSEKNITFSFVEEFYKREKKLDVNSSFNLTVSGAYKDITTYQLIDSTKIVMGQNNVYAMQNTEKPIDSLVKDYSSIADKSQMYVIVRSNDEVLTVGHSHHDILMNDPKVRASHLVGSGGESVFVITSGHEKLTLAKLPISDVIIYDFDQENKIDTLSLREIKEQLKKDIDREINIEVSKIASDLLINLSLDDEFKTEVVKVKLKGALENNWYKRVHIVMDSVCVIEEILDDFELTPQPLIFDDNSKTIYVINPKDVVKGDKIRVKKEIGDYTFARDNDALVITNSLSSSVDKNNLFSVILNDFYHENNQDKMQTLKIEFNDKKILLRKEIERINSAGNFSELKRKVRIDSYKAIMRTIKEQKLFEAIKENNIGEVRELIDHGVSIDARNIDGQQLLHSAASHGNLEVVKYLIEEKSANVNARDNYGDTPLHSAAVNGNLEIVKYFIEEKGADVNVRNNAGQTPLHLAVSNGEQYAAEYLIERKNANFNVKDNAGQTPLHYAAKSGNLKMVQYLIGVKGADFKLSDNLGQTPLHLAALYGKLKVVKYLVEKGVNVIGVFQISPLPYAAESGSLEVVKYLVEEKGVIGVIGVFGKSLLYYAAESGSLEVIKYLVEEKGVDFNVRSDSGMSPLHYAAKGGSLEVVKYLVEEKSIDINVKTLAGAIPLHLAALNGKLKVVKYLIENGADFNVRASDGMTPLHYAVNNITLEVVKYLVEEKSADVNVKDNSGITPLHYAADYGKLEMVKYLIKKGAKIDLKVNGKTPLEMLKDKILADAIIKELTERLFDAVKYDDFSEVHVLINQGVSVNVKDSDGQTLLHCAVSNGKLKVAKYLIEKKGVDFNVKEGDFGWTLLHLAAAKGNLEVVKYFIERKQVDFNVGDNYKITPLHYAVEYGKLEVVKYLLEKKNTNINVKDGSGKVPLHYAVVSNDIEVVRYLVEKRSDSVNVTDNDGQTPLHYAAKIGNLEIVKYLEEKGADVNVNGNSGETLLHSAAEGGNLEVVRYLLEKKNANINVTDDSGRTPLDLATSNRCSGVVEYLERKLNEKRERPQQRKRRHHHGDLNLHHSSHRLLAIDSSNQPEIAASNASQKSSWINDLVGWVKNSIGKLSSKPEETSSTVSSISQVDMQIDIVGTIMLLDVLIRKVTGQKYIASADQDVSLIEAQGYALNIIEKFEKVLNETAMKSGIPAINLNFNPLKPQLAIVGQIRNGKFSEISNTLYSFAKEACPELEQTGKFLTCLKSNLEGEKEAVLLQQKVEQTSDQQISRKVVAEELPKKPDTLLNGTSVVKGINNVLGL